MAGGDRPLSPLSNVSADLETGEFVFSGPVVELVEGLVESNGKEVEFIPLRWDRMEDHFLIDECDFLAPLFPSDRRSKFGTVVGVMYSVGLGAVAMRSNDAISTPTDVGGKDVRVGVVEGEVGWEYLQDEYPAKLDSTNVSITKGLDITDIMYAVLDNRIDIAVADAISCNRFILQNDPANVRLHNPFLTQPPRLFDVGLMVRKEDQSFASWLDEEVRKVRLSVDFLQYEAGALDGWGKQIVRRNIPEGTKFPRIK